MDDDLCHVVDDDFCHVDINIPEEISLELPERPEEIPLELPESSEQQLSYLELIKKNINMTICEFENYCLCFNEPPSYSLENALLNFVISMLKKYKELLIIINDDCIEFNYVKSQDSYGVEYIYDLKRFTSQWSRDWSVFVQ